MSEKVERLIFVLSPGRCGTMWLARQMGLIPGILATHEPGPRFTQITRKINYDDKDTRQFWIDKKIPAVRASMKKAKVTTYIETSHIFVHGFVESLLSLSIVPDVIVIKRNPHEVALSLWRRRSVPGRSRRGRIYLLHPQMLRIWKILTDYQLCFWHAVEAQRRSCIEAVKIKAAGGSVIVTNTPKMVTKDGFDRLCVDLKIPIIPDDKFINERINTRTYIGPTKFPSGNLDTQRRQILMEIAKR